MVLEWMEALVRLVGVYGVRGVVVLCGVRGVSVVVVLSGVRGALGGVGVRLLTQGLGDIHGI